MDEKDLAIGTVITSFVHDVDALDEMLTKAMFMVSAAEKSQNKLFKEFADRYGEPIESEMGRKGHSFPREYVRQAMRLDRKRRYAARGFDLVPRSFVVSLVSSFDAHVGRLLSIIYSRRPELLDATDRNLSLVEIKNLGSIDAAVEFLLGKEIETLLRQSHAEQFASMERRFGLKLREGLNSWSTFIELTQRRNCFVHNGGFASEQYLRICREHGVKLEDGLTVGEPLLVSPEYFSRAHSCVFEIGVKLGQVLWRKLLPQDLGEADSNLISVIYDLISEDRLDLARNLSDFACETLKRHASEQDRRIFLINRAQAYKWSGNQERCLALLDAEDWSACSDDFALAQQVLRDDFDSAAKTMRRIGDNGTVKQESYADWPIFRVFRTDHRFLETFEDIFGKPFIDLEKVLSLEQEQKFQKLLGRFREVWNKARKDEDS